MISPQINIILVLTAPDFVLRSLFGRIQTSFAIFWLEQSFFSLQSCFTLEVWTTLLRFFKITELFTEFSVSVTENLLIMLRAKASVTEWRQSPCEQPKKKTKARENSNSNSKKIIYLHKLSLARAADCTFSGFVVLFL